MKIMVSITKSKLHFILIEATDRFMEVVLPCDDLYMRSVVTQRPSYDCPPSQCLSFTVEKELALLLQKEVEYHK